MRDPDAITSRKGALRRPRFKPHFQVRVLEPDLVYLLSEAQTFVLNGRLYFRLAPFLDGDHSVQDMVRELGGPSAQLGIEYALARLVGRGFVTYRDPGPGPDAAYWSLLGVNPLKAREKLASARIQVTGVGETSPLAMLETLQDLGISAEPLSMESSSQDRSEDTHLLLVVTDDYLRPELARINQQVLAKPRPWMLVKPTGSVLWLGPVMIPGRTGCWSCMAQRLQGNRPVEAFIKGKLKDLAHCIPTSLGSLAPTRTAGIQLAATELMKWLVRDRDPDGDREGAGGAASKQPADLLLLNRLVTLDTATLESQSHWVPRRPQCPACGAPLDPASPPEPVTLQPRKKRFTRDGGHRSLTPEETRQRWQHHLSPVTGIVNAVESLSEESDQLLHMYQSVVPFGVSLRYARSSDILHRRCSGKGKTASQAWTSAFSEGIERYSALYTGHWERFRMASLKELGEAGIHPNQVLHFSRDQYENRTAWNEAHTEERYLIPRPFREDEVIPWTPLWSLTHERVRYLPRLMCHFGSPLPEEEPFAVPDSNGLAAGNNLEEAVLQGLLEVMERDAFALWWYNRVRRPGVELASFGDPFLVDLEEAFQQRGRELWALDITSDLDVSTFVAFSRRTGQDMEAICLGAGTHVDPHIALLRAITEMIQSTVPTDQVDWDGPTPHHDPIRVQWMREMRIARNPHLTPDPERSPRVRGDFSYRPQEDLLQDIETLVDLLARKGLETLVLDLTKPDIGMSVARVFVPGLRPYTRRLAPGRLYDVPAEMGWLPAALSESEMNPFPMFL